nr:uncharacterized protein LOC112003738 [Quercus suber]
MDLGYRGADFTWCNMQDGENRIQLRLDRALANTEWLGKFDGMRVYHLVDSTSDHCALLLTDTPPHRVSNAKRFHFEALWTKNEECRNIIESSWGMGVDLSTPEGIMENLKRCASELSSWSTTVYGHIPKKIQSKRNTLSALTQQDKNGELSTEIRNLRRVLNELWCDEKEIIARAVVDYFENIYSTAFPTRIEDVVNAIPTKVTEDMNESLSRDLTREEVATALKLIHPTKAPGPDGMSAIFYQKYWSIVGNSVTNMVLNVLNNNLPMTEINKTNISLIPKTSSPKKMTDFRPISLCNVIYKLISKTLANRLKNLLPHIISENQSAFTPDRLITDNVLVAFELMHYLNHKTAGNEGYMAVKLDMSKAFDKVEWGFIKRVMEKLGVCAKWVFSILKERVGQKLAGWKGKLLSMGGKEILIKAVAQAIPTYTMSCFQLPQGLCEDLESMMRNFWWGQKHQESKMAWVGWKRMCSSKTNGGMGFRNLQAFNLAMLAKQAWRILTNPNSLIARVLKARYFPFGDILTATLGSNPSYSWRSIFHSLGVIRMGTQWHVGNGKKVHIWDDKWLPTPTTHKVITPPNNLLTFPMVSSLIDPNTKWWRAEVINTTFLPFEAETILRIPLSRSLPEDK